MLSPVGPILKHQSDDGTFRVKESRKGSIDIQSSVVIVKGIFEEGSLFKTHPV